MMQRPGCFVWVILAAFVGMYAFVNWANGVKTTGEASAMQPSVGPSRAPTASATMILTSTPNPLVLTEASSNATHSAVLTAIGNDQATQDVGTRIARTETPAAWTAQAIDVEQKREAAVRDKALLEAQLLAGTITAAPTSEWKTEVALWPTVEAQMTQAAFDQQTADNARKWGRIAADAWSLVLVAIPVSVILALIVSSVVMPNAFSWRLQGVSGGQAQASVVAAARTVPVTENKKTREVVMDADRAQLIRFVDMCRSLSGDDAKTITPQNDERIRSKEWWRQCVRALGELDLVDASQGSGHGTTITHDRTLADLADVLRKGNEG